MVHKCSECHVVLDSEHAHCSLHLRADDLIDALEHARTQLTERDWLERELHEPLQTTIDRIDKLLGKVE